MIRERKILIKRISLLLDWAANLFAFYIAFTIKTNFLPLNLRGLVITDEIVVTVVLIPFIYYFWGSRFKVFDTNVSKNIGKILSIVIKTMIGVNVTLLVFFFLFKFQAMSRIFIVLYGGIAVSLISANKVLLQRLVRYLNWKIARRRNVVIVGSGGKAKEFIQTVQENNIWGIDIIGLIDKEGKLTGKKQYGYDVLGSRQDIRHILLNYPIDEVVCTLPFHEMDNIRGILKTCEELGVTVRIVSNFFKTLIAKTHIDDLNGLPIITFSSVPDNLVSVFLKRFLDILISVLVLAIFSPIFFTVGLLIKLTSRGPVFFVQERCGLNGRRFRMLKFRTMVQNAEALKGSLSNLNEMSGPVFKIKDDPRVTSIGKLLRKTSLDEFPQFVNVLKGEMSIVGPRPPIPKEVAAYEFWQRRRLSMRPGLTCFWQVSGRNKIGFEDWMKLDLKYIDSWSIWLDLKIIFKTIPMVLLGKGAS